MSLETSARARPLRLVRTIDVAVALAVPDRVSGAFAARRSADSLDNHDDDSRVDAARSRAGLAADTCRRGTDVRHRADVRVLLRHRADRIRGRIQARPRGSEDAGLALLAALPVPTVDVRGAAEVDQDRDLRHPRGMGKARAEGDGGASR